jgi:hypothetical protein
MGKRVLHFIRRDSDSEEQPALDGADGPLLCLDEVAVKVFGIDCIIKVGSKETLRNHLRGFSPAEGHYELCDDGGILAPLAASGVIGRTAYKVGLLSLKAMVSLLKRRGAGPALLAPFISLDVATMFDDCMGGGLDQAEDPAQLSTMATARLLKQATKKPKLSLQLQAAPGGGAQVGPLAAASEAARKAKQNAARKALLQQLQRFGRRATTGARVADMPVAPDRNQHTSRTSPPSMRVTAAPQPSTAVTARLPRHTLRDQPISGMEDASSSEDEIAPLSAALAGVQLDSDSQDSEMDDVELDNMTAAVRQALRREADMHSQREANKARVSAGMRGLAN